MGKHSYNQEDEKKRKEQEDLETLRKLRAEEKHKEEHKEERKVEDIYDDEDEDDNYEYEEKKSKKGLVILIILVLLICAGVGGFFGWKYYNSNKNNQNVTNDNPVAETEKEPEPEPVKEIKIFNGNQRPIACMIDNHKDAWPQFSINDAYLVYEIIVEGGETRLMALFQNKDVNVGPMRSSRHYFLDYALENDAIYAHIGWSPQAEKDIPALGVNNINGLYYDTGKSYKEGDVFWRLYGGKYVAPHNSITSTTALRNAATEKGYAQTTSKGSVLNYVADEISLEEKTDAVVATDVVIPFSTLQKVEFKYDETTGRYTRYARGTVQTDASSGENITTKNIIITFAENYTLNDGQNKGRQGLKNIGTMKGYYITNGKSIPITCTKNSRTEKTIYKDAEGNEINVNDGNTFIEICPINAAVTIQ